MFIFFNANIAMAACVASGMFSMADMAYDASMINQLLLSENFYEFFELTSTWIGLNVAIVNVGNFIAGPFAGPLIDWLGRKKALFVSNILAIVGVIVQATAQSEGALLGGRFVLGLAFTISGVAGPSLVAETTPAKWHSLLTNCVVLGLPICGSAIAAGSIGVYESKTDWGWRGAILGELGPPLISLICLPFVPESPRWLAYQGRVDEAKQVIERMHSTNDPNREAIVQLEYDQIVNTLEFEHHIEETGASSWKSLVADPADRRRFLIAVLTNIFFQISGSNTFPYFFTLLLGAAGVTDPKTTLFINLGLCIWGTFAVGFGLWVCERVGAKQSLMWNTSLMTLCLVLLAVLSGLSGRDTRYGKAAVAVIFIFQFASFSSWMILTYTYPPQILRFTQRARGFALAQSLGYGFCIMMSYTLPLALEHLAWRFYAINAAWNVGIVLVIWWLFVEIKGKTLEETDAVFDGRVHFEVSEDKTGTNIIEGVEPESDSSPRSDSMEAKRNKV
ncbi:general substrate transporter [Whalleya microplaca]|nr:general substrate transporter [Whalleya microplaca]